MDKEFETKETFKRIAISALKNGDFLWGVKFCLTTPGMFGIVKITIILK